MSQLAEKVNQRINPKRLGLAKSHYLARYELHSQDIATSHINITRLKRLKRCFSLPIDK